MFDPLHPYTKGLMGSIIVPEEGLRDVKLTAIPGMPPNLKNRRPAAGLPNAASMCSPNAMHSVPSMMRMDNGRAYRCILPEDEFREMYAR